MLPAIDKPTTIIYQGGSGGFFLYYLLLLSKDSHLPSDIVWRKIYNQFPEFLKNNIKDWKKYEEWPDKNDKVSMLCNPFFNKDLILKNYQSTKNRYKILLYTDLSTQLRLAYDKNAYWFTDISKQYFNAPDSITAYLRQIKSNYKLFENKKVDPEVVKINSVYNPELILDLKDILKMNLNIDQEKFKTYWLSIQSSKFKY